MIINKNYGIWDKSDSSYLEDIIYQLYLNIVIRYNKSANTQSFLIRNYKTINIFRSMEIKDFSSYDLYYESKLIIRKEKIKRLKVNIINEKTII